MTTNPENRVRAIGDRVFVAMKNNPEGLLLLAAGCALLMRSKAGAAPSTGSRYRPNHSDHGAEMTGSVYETVSSAAETAKDYVADATEKVTETAQSYASSATQFAEQTRRSVSEKSGRLAEQAQSTMRGQFARVIQDQPLVLVFAGLAAGAAVASALPPTEIENKALGPTGEFAADLATKTGERLKDATAKVGEQLKADAEKRGLNTEGMKEMVREAADAFEKAVAGDNPRDAGGAGPTADRATVEGGRWPGNTGQSQGVLPSRRDVGGSNPASNK